MFCSSECTDVKRGISDAPIASAGRRLFGHPKRVFKETPENIQHAASIRDRFGRLSRFMTKALNCYD